MAVVKRSLTDIEKQIEEADAAVAGERTGYPGMSYVEGVSDALRWVLGRSDEEPMEEE